MNKTMLKWVGVALATLLAAGATFAQQKKTLAVVVKGLLDPRWRVEIEADAVLRP